MDKRVYRRDNLPDEIADAIETSRMNPKHDHLDALLSTFKESEKMTFASIEAKDILADLVAWADNGGTQELQDVYVMAFVHGFRSTHPHDGKTLADIVEEARRLLSD